MAKLSDAQITALRDLAEYGHFQHGTRKATVQVLVRDGYVFESVAFLNGTDSGVYELLDRGKEALALNGGWNEPTTTVDEILGELNTNPWDETPESDEPNPWVPFFNRKARRDLLRNLARMNRNRMRNEGKRRKRYGADDPQYLRRRYDVVALAA